MVQAQNERENAITAKELADQRFESVLEFVNTVVHEAGPEIQDLLGASKGWSMLTNASLEFLESIGNEEILDSRFKLVIARLHGEIAEVHHGTATGYPHAERALALFVPYTKHTLTIQKSVETLPLHSIESNGLSNRKKKNQSWRKSTRNL